MHIFAENIPLFPNIGWNTYPFNGPERAPLQPWNSTPFPLNSGRTWFQILAEWAPRGHHWTQRGARIPRPQSDQCEFSLMLGAICRLNSFSGQRPITSLPQHTIAGCMSVTPQFYHHMKSRLPASGGEPLTSSGANTKQWRYDLGYWGVDYSTYISGGVHGVGHLRRLCRIRTQDWFSTLPATESYASTLWMVMDMCIYLEYLSMPI